MRLASAVVTLVLGATSVAAAGPASGTVKTPTGTISPKFAIAYVVRDQFNPRQSVVELLLSEVAVDPAKLNDDLDRHVAAINFDALRDHNYVLLWVAPDGSVKMNATYSKTMTQYANDSTGGLKAEFTTNTAAKIDGRVYAPTPLKVMDGSTYTVDVKFTADVIPALTGTPLPAGGGDPGRALTAFIGAVAKKDWKGVKAGLAPATLKNYDHDYNSEAENAASAIDILNARLTVAKSKVTGGFLTSPTVAIVEMEGDRFGTMWVSVVRMVKTGAVWQYEDSRPVGMLK